MPNRRRSPFGELLYRHRRRLGYSQRDLADRTFQLARTDPDATPVSERTVLSLERRSTDPSTWRTPRLSTARTLAKALGLQPGSPDYDAFLESVTGTRDRSPVMLGTPVGTRPAPRTAPDFVIAGREPHLERIRTAIDLAASGSAGAVFVGADPGTGKTSLVTEACRDALERYPGTAVLWTQCNDHDGNGTSLEPFRRMLGLTLGDLATASPRERLSDANLAELHRRAPIAARALLDDGGPLLMEIVPVESLRSTSLAMLGADLRQELDIAARRTTGQGDHPDLPEALYRVLARYAAAGPVILVIEDLQWADQHTLAAVAHLLTRLFEQRIPLLLIGTWQPGQPTSQEGPHGYTLASVLRMTPRLFPGALIDLSTAVGGEAGRAFVEAAVARSGIKGGVDLVEPIFARTGGMPVFVMSILRLCEQEVRAGRELAPDLLEHRIPAEIQNIFVEQLHRLPEEVQRLLEAASVQGSEFWAEVVMKALGLSRAAFIDMVDSQLVRQFRMLLPGGTVTVADQPAHRYQFSHALLRDVIYRRMTELQCAHYHALTAEAMRALYGDKGHDAVEAIAFHHDRAGERLTAARAYLNAADHALNNHQIDRATRLFSRVEALNVRTQDPVLPMYATIGLANCERRLGNLSRARQLLEHASFLAAEYHYPSVQAHAQESLALVDMDAGSIQDGIDRLRAAIALWEGESDENAARAMTNLSYLLYGAGRYDEGIAQASRARAISSRLGDQRLWLDSQIALANCHLDLGLYAEAAAAYRDAIGVCRAVGDAHREHLCHLNLALVALETGDLAGCLAEAGILLDPAEHASSHLRGYAELDLGMAFEAQGDLASAGRHFERSRQIREQIGQGALLIDSLAGLLRVAVAEGDRPAARTLLDDIEQRVRQQGLDGVEHAGRLYLSLIDAAAFLGRDAAAREYLNQAVALLTQRADRLANPAHRESYLSNPPTHRRIMGMAGSLPADGSP